MAGAAAGDVVAGVVVSGVILAVLKFWEELAKRRVFDQVSRLLGFP